MTDLSMPTPLVEAGTCAVAPASIERLLNTRRGNAREVVQAARDFESVLLHRLMEEMRRTIPKSELLDTGTSDQIQGLFWMYLAKHMADQGGIGLWKDIAQQMARQAAEDGPHRLEVDA
ncbi:MAG TPA: rod-binding protein [Phycisphaerae bacterium]|nr:rod-binding protein [Phycisphaerae bacterium]